MIAFGLFCLFIYVVASLCGHHPTYHSSPMSEVRNKYMGKSPALKAVKRVKARKR
jgi:hypothetical protein